MSSTTPQRSLVIDEHPDAAESFREVFSLFGHEAEVAMTGEEGLPMIRARRPEVVFCDWRLPGMNGPDVVRVVTAQCYWCGEPVAVRLELRKTCRSLPCRSSLWAPAPRPSDPAQQ